MPKTDEVTLALVRARERISDPARWTTDQMAINADGHPVFPTRPAAVAWCAVGAVRAEAGDELRLYFQAIARLERGARMGRVFDVNDKEGHAAVLALFDEAIREK